MVAATEVVVTVEAAVAAEAEAVGKCATDRRVIHVSTSQHTPTHIFPHFDTGCAAFMVKG